MGLEERIEAAVRCGAAVMDAAAVRAALPRRDPMGHKGDFGRVHIIGGCVGYTGAPALAALGALRSGAGLVSLSVPASVYPIVAGNCLEAMARPMPAEPDGMLSPAAADAALEALEGKDACLLGPGLGRSGAASRLVRLVLERMPGPVVLDADGLNAAAAHINQLDARRGRVTVVTPHEGEFLRLGGELSLGRPEAAREFARVHGCVTVLKGPGTVTAAPDGRLFVNPTGGCGMAKGGSGDVLGGVILALIGQGMEPALAAAAGVWLHGRAGDLAAAELGSFGMLPSDLAGKLPRAFLEILGQ